MAAKNPVGPNRQAPTSPPPRGTPERDVRDMTAPQRRVLRTMAGRFDQGAPVSAYEAARLSNAPRSSVRALVHRGLLDWVDGWPTQHVRLAERGLAAYPVLLAEEVPFLSSPRFRRGR